MSELPPEASVRHASPMSSRQTPQANSDNTGESVAAHRHRWLKKETVDLLRIRSDMDTAFQDAALKAPLWAEVSRKMGEMGYNRSGMKCKEKFENVRKYYLRTKKGLNSWADGKNYCCFDQVKTFHGGAIATAAPAPALLPVPATAHTTAIAPPPAPVWSADTPVTSRLITEPGKVTQPTGLGFPSNNWSSSSSETDDESKEAGEGRKRKRDISGDASGSCKMRAFLERLISQLVERLETMQQQFLETIDKREAERLAREEARSLQEAARLSHKHALLSHERSTAATRDAAILSFLQKFIDQSVELPPPPPAPEHPPQLAPHPPQSHPSPLQKCSTVMPQPLAPAALELVPVPDPKPVRMVTFSRWPKDEIETLIRIRTGLDHRYQEAGPKGPLWDEISVEMQRQGYNRSTKKCKEKWENVNKYFKKMKENSRRRPPDAKTCPYYHQLDTLYRQKHLNNSMVSSQNAPEAAQGENKGNRPGWNAQGSGGAVTNGGDIVMEPSMAKDAGNDYEKLNGLESDDGDDAEGGNMQYEVRYQRQNKRRNGGGAACSFFAML